MTDNLPAVREETRTLVPQNPDSWIAVVDNVASFANQICNTEFVPKGLRGKPAAVAAAMLSGRELGLPPMTSLQGMHVVDGRPGLSAEMMRALVLAAGHEIEFTDSTGALCTIRGKRRGRDTWQQVTWTIDMARAAGLGGKDNWKNYPRALLQARATTELCRMIFADVIHGFRSSEELEDMGDQEETGGTATAAAEGSATVKRAGRRTQKKAPADLPTAGAPTPVSPPLPGEPGYDDPPVEHSGEEGEPDAGGDDSVDTTSPEAGDAGAGDVPSEVPASVSSDDGGETDPSPPSEAGEAGGPVDERPPVSPPLDDDEPAGDEAGPRMITRAQMRMYHATFKEIGLGGEENRDRRLHIVNVLVGHPVDTTSDLTLDEAKVVLDTVARMGSAADLEALIEATEAQQES